MKTHLLSGLLVALCLCIFVFSWLLSKQSVFGNQSFDVEYQEQLISASMVYQNGVGIVVVEAMDYECPPCRAQQQQVNSILEAHPSIQWRVIPLQNQLHPLSLEALKLAHIAGRQGRFPEYHRVAMARSVFTKREVQELRKLVGRDQETGSSYASRLSQISKLKIGATPTYFVFTGNSGIVLYSAKSVQEFLSK